MTNVAKGQLVLHGQHAQQVPGPDGKPVTVYEPTAYPVDWPAILAGENTSVNVQIEGDRDFLLTHITHNQSDAAGFIPLRFQVSESDGRTLFHEPVYINAASSPNAGQPFNLSIRKLYRRTMLVKVAFLVDAA